jgi:hypothetical protein
MLRFAASAAWLGIGNILASTLLVHEQVCRLFVKISWTFRFCQHFRNWTRAAHINWISRHQYAKHQRVACAGSEAVRMRKPKATIPHIFGLSVTVEATGRLMNVKGNTVSVLFGHVSELPPTVSAPL